jgi:hypothetical protein
VRLPEDVDARLRQDRTVAGISRQLRQRLFACSGQRLRLNGSYGKISSALLYMRSRERLRDRLWYAIRMAREFAGLCTFSPNAQDRAVVRLPAAVAFAYYAIRPIRVGLAFGPRVLAQFREIRR